MLEKYIIILLFGGSWYEKCPLDAQKCIDDTHGSCNGNVYKYLVDINNSIDECDTNGVRYFPSPHVPHWYGQPRTRMKALTGSFLGK